MIRVFVDSVPGQVINRILAGIITLLVIIVVTYLLFTVTPADPALLSCGRPCTPERLEQARQFMALDKPWFAQVGDFLAGIFVGRTFGTGPAAIHCSAPCLGYSVQLDEPVTDLIMNRIPVTASLVVGSAILWIIVGVGAGIAAAYFRGTWIDRTILGLSVGGISTPIYLAGLVGLLIFGFWLNIVPTDGYTPFSQNPGRWLWALVLPCVTLAAVHAATYSRLTRSQMLTQLNANYVRTERSIGLRDGQVIWRHALPNSAPPLVTLLALDIGGLFGGAVITERVFSFPGLGTLILDAVATFDLPVIIGVVLISAAAIVIANAIADLVNLGIDPRLRIHQHKFLPTQATSSTK